MSEVIEQELPLTIPAPLLLSRMADQVQAESVVLVLTWDHATRDYRVSMNFQDKNLAARIMMATALDLKAGNSTQEIERVLTN
jgi:hypothetical protein